MTAKKPGANIPESQRHTVQRKFRISPEASTKLDALTVAAELPASRVVEALIEQASRAPKRKAT